jgi:hypothetical protein
MDHTISLTEWLRHLEREYLSSFIRDGGAAVKFAVTTEDARPALRAALQTICRESDYLLLELDAAEMRAHMPQDIFFEIAAQLDWRRLARQRILRLAAASDYDVAGIDPAETANVFQAIADIPGLEAGFVVSEMRKPMEDSIATNRDLARDFRLAMTQLCLRENTRDGAYDAQPLLDWLTGENKLISNVRPFQIFTRIDRTSARHFIESTLHWVRDAGHAGTVILLDNSRIMTPRNPHDGLRYYTKATVMDHYELLRQFIDGVDRLAGTLLLVVTDEEFLDLDSKRGFGIYPALQTRVMDDVRDRNLVNPVATLARLAQGEAEHDASQ